MGSTSSSRINISFASLGLILFLLFPYFVLLLHVRGSYSVDWPELWWATKNTFLQAAFSGLGAVILGFVMALGLLKLKNGRGKTWFSFCEWALWMPSLLPPLFTIVIFFSVLEIFPVGLIGVTIIHTGIYSGLCAVILARIMQDKYSRLSQVAWLNGASSRLFLKASGRDIGLDLLGLFLMVFSVCWTSFSIPLAVGGGKGTVIEILIYEKLRLSDDWSQALSLALIQTVFLLGINFIYGSKQLPTTSESTSSMDTASPVLQSKIGAAFVAAYILFFSLGFLVSIGSGWDKLFENDELLSLVQAAVFNSLALALVGGFFCGSIILLICYPSNKEFILRLIRSYLPPSTSLVAMSLIFFPTANPVLLFAKYIFGIGILSVTGLYRLGAEQAFSSLRGQIQMASLLGAPSFVIFKNIVFPQMLPVVLRLSGVGCLWVIGDFALGKILLAGDQTLPLLIEGLMSSYRMEAASVLTGLMIAMGAMLFLIFWGVSDVYRRRAL